MGESRQGTARNSCTSNGRVCRQSIDDLTAHHVITKSQSAYYKEARDALSPNQALILLDFAENYSFLVQDAIQGYHWVNDQANMHPFSVYTTKGHDSYCVISDHMAHSSIAVHAFQTAVLEDLKAKHPEINEIIYFSDGAGSQYKNFKNLTNLLHHESD